MQSKNLQGATRNQHFLPKHYLKGFTERTNSPFIWVYRRGKSYSPGTQKNKHNPYRQSIKAVGMIKDFYAYKKLDGTVDIESYENQLAIRENGDARLLQKIRNTELLNERERLEFSRYMILMHKRVPARQENFNKTLWPNTVDQEISDSPFSHLGQTERGRLFVEEYKQNPSDKLRLDSMLGDMNVAVPMLSKMNWAVLSAPKGKGFIAGDNPIFFGSGIKHKYSKVIFPISTNAVLIATPDGNFDMVFGQATDSDVIKVNEIIAYIATNEIYYAHNVHWLVDMINNDS